MPTLLTSLPQAGGEADAPTFFVFSGILPHFPSPVNNFFPVMHTLLISGHTDAVPTPEKEVPHMDERKNAKTEQNTTEQNTPNTGKNAKNTKNAKNCK